eukprot:Awhi_evm1s4170
MNPLYSASLPPSTTTTTFETAVVAGIVGKGMIGQSIGCNSEDSCGLETTDYVNVDKQNLTMTPSGLGTACANVDKLNLPGNPLTVGYIANSSS